MQVRTVGLCPIALHARQGLLIVHRLSGRNVALSNPEQACLQADWNNGVCNSECNTRACGHNVLLSPDLPPSDVKSDPLWLPLQDCLYNEIVVKCTIEQEAGTVDFRAPPTKDELDAYTASLSASETVNTGTASSPPPPPGLDPDQADVPNESSNATVSATDACQFLINWMNGAYTACLDSCCQFSECIDYIANNYTECQSEAAISCYSSCFAPAWVPPPMILVSTCCSVWTNLPPFPPKPPLPPPPPPPQTPPPPPSPHPPPPPVPQRPPVGVELAVKETQLVDVNLQLVMSSPARLAISEEVNEMILFQEFQYTLRSSTAKRRKDASTVTHTIRAPLQVHDAVAGPAYHAEPLPVQGE